MLVVLVGKSCSGKDSIRNELVKYGLKPVVTYTTRPMRPGEKDGVAYHFISADKFDKMEKSHMFAETTSYKVVDGSTWRYGTPVDELVNGDNKMIILNPDGLKAIREMPNIKMLAFHITANDGVLLNRAKLRGGDSGEIARRLAADKKDFADISNFVDFTISNQGEMTPELAAHIIYKVKNIMEGYNNEDIIE